MIKTALYPILGHYIPIPTKATLNIFKFFIRTRLTYAIPTQGAEISKKNWNNFETIPNVTLRITTSLPRHIQNNTIKNSIKTPSLKDKHQKDDF